MKNIIAPIIIGLFLVNLSYSQEIQKQIPLIHVNGEGKVFSKPDQVSINVSVETKGKDASEVKKLNDTKINSVLKAIKKWNLPTEDYQTDRISLNPQFDWVTKKHNYHAVQSIKILLKDISKFDGLMEDMVNAGINHINSVEFKSSILSQLQSEARKLAMSNAKKKAEDYISVLNQKVGKVFTVNDNSQVNYPHISNRFMMAKMSQESDAPAPMETLATGEIEITANVNVSFMID